MEEENEPFAFNFIDGETKEIIHTVMVVFAELGDKDSFSYINSEGETITVKPINED